MKSLIKYFLVFYFFLEIPLVITNEYFLLFFSLNITDMIFFVGNSVALYQSSSGVEFNEFVLVPCFFFYT